MPVKRLVAAMLLAAVAGAAPGFGQWWMEEPVRLIQTNLREIDSGLDAARLARQLADLRANALLFGMGGIVAHYPTEVEFHYRSPTLPADRDTFGEMLGEAHRRGIRVIGRFDFSKTQKAVYEAHPEWFFKRANGEPVIYNGLYSVCINGGYYREQIFKILTEALRRYEVDGVFFNMFGNPRRDYSGNELGPCHCDNCRREFRQRYGRELPADDRDAEYREFLHRSSLAVAEKIGKLVRKLRPRATFNTYRHEFVTGIMSESNTSVARALPQWPYSASDNINYARNSEPGKMAFNLSISFVDYAWRFASVPPEETKLRLREAMAHGGPVAVTVLGTLGQEDRTPLIAAKPLFAWHAEHEELYVHQEHDGRVILMGPRGEAYRGMFRVLSEEHIPFRASANTKWLDDGRAAEISLVICTSDVPAELERWVRDGGRLLVAGTNPPTFGLPKSVKRWTDVRGYFRVRDHELLPSLGNTDLIFQYGDYIEYPALANDILTYIPPSMFGPPEKVFTDKVETRKPGVLIREVGKGKMVYLPWDVGRLYYRYSNHWHKALISDLIDHLLPEGRQVITNAHPLVEISLMRQGARSLVHFVNLSGHSQTGYFKPLSMDGIDFAVKTAHARARSAKLEWALKVERDKEYLRVTLPRLEGYDVVVLE